MALPDNSVAITAGAGTIVATQTANSKHYQVVMVADDSGHLQQTLPTYTLWIPGVAVGSGKKHADLFNASGSGKTIEIRGLWAIPKSDVAVTGVLGVELALYRTLGAGTGGTTATYNTTGTSNSPCITPFDTANTAPPAQITARSAPTGGATTSSIFWAQYISTEETNAATYVCAMTNLLPIGTMNQRITLNQGQGLVIWQGNVAGVGSMAYLVLFTLV